MYDRYDKYSGLQAPSYCALCELCFFKQKTAYEMRISDWSSDVCSSDLLLIARAELDYPDVLVNREVEREIDRQSNHASHTPEGLQNWLDAIGKTEAEDREDLRDQADITV